MDLIWAIIAFAGITVLVMIWRLPQASKKLADALRPSNDFALQQEMLKEELLLELLDEWEDNGVSPKSIASLLRNKRQRGDLPDCVDSDDFGNPETLRQKIQRHRNEA